jgi:hypothetical protein
MAASSASRLLVIGFCIVVMLIATAAASGHPHLSSRQAVAIAEAQAQRALRHTNLADYHRTSVRYIEDKHSWYVGYQHKKVPSTWFDVVVDDRTRKAAVVME